MQRFRPEGTSVPCRLVCIGGQTRVVGRQGLYQGSRVQGSTTALDWVSGIWISSKVPATLVYELPGFCKFLESTLGFHC